MSSEFHGVSAHVKITIAPENIPKFFEAFQTLFEKITAEPECMFFEVYQSPENPGELSFVENWSKPIEWLMENQITKEYYMDCFAITDPMNLKPKEIKIWNRLGSPYVVWKQKDYNA